MKWLFYFVLPVAIIGFLVSRGVNRETKSLSSSLTGDATSLINKLIPPIPPKAAAASAGHTIGQAYPGSHAVYYTPEVNPELVDVTYLGKATDHLDMALYSFTDKAVAEAVLAAAHRGVHVRIYRDRDQFEQELSRNAYMAEIFKDDANIEIRVKGSRSLMHLKSWATPTILRDGSSNLSAAAKHQDNTVIISSDPAEIKDFEEKFEDMWNRPDNLKVQ